MADEFVLPKDIGKVDCSDTQTFGEKSSLYNYIVKSITGDEDYPSDACSPWVHGNFQVDNIQLNTSLTGNGSISVIGNVSSNGGSHILSNKKNLPFDMPHPNKEGWRLRHVCIEGPEIAVYCRGKVPPDGVIDLPSFWDGLINPEDMSISLNPTCSMEIYSRPP